MQNKGKILTLSAFGAGIIIAALRIIHKSTYGANGLPADGFLTVLLSALAIAAIIFAYVTASLISREKDSEKEVSKIMASSNKIITLILQIVAAVLVLIHALLSYPTFPEIIKDFVHKNFL